MTWFEKSLGEAHIRLYDCGPGHLTLTLEEDRGGSAGAVLSAEDARRIAAELVALADEVDV